MIASARQSGQVMPVVALLSSVLVGFVGLVIDVGGVTSEHELAQGAADGAALTAAHDIVQGGTEANATTHAKAVLTQDGLPAAAVTLSYLDSGGTPTATAAAVATVQAVLAYNYPTRFLPILGVSTVGVGATAQAAVPWSGPPCGLCIMSAAGNALSLGAGSHVTVNFAGVVDNSTGNPNLTSTAGSVLFSRSNRLPINHVSGTGTITPAATVGSAVANPLPALAIPAFGGGGSIPFNSPASGSLTANPGDYGAVTINGTYAITLNPGVYTFNGPVTVNGGSITGMDVTLYFECGGSGNTPRNCAAGGEAGGNLVINGGVANFAAPTTGTYNGVVMFGDRHNTSTNTLNGGSNSLVTTGTIYTEAMPWVLAKPGDSYTLSSELIASTLTTGSSTVLTLNYAANQNAPGQVGTTATGTPGLSL